MKKNNKNSVKNSQNMPNFVPPVFPSPVGVPAPILSTAPSEKNVTGMNNPVVQAVLGQQPEQSDPAANYK